MQCATNIYIIEKPFQIFQDRQIIFQANSMKSIVRSANSQYSNKDKENEQYKRDIHYSLEKKYKLYNAFLKVSPKGKKKLLFKQCISKFLPNFTNKVENVIINIKGYNKRLPTVIYLNKTYFKQKSSPLRPICTHVQQATIMFENN